MLQIRKLLGPQAWERLQAELPMIGAAGHPGPEGTERRVIRKRGPDGKVETILVR